MLLVLVCLNMALESSSWSRYWFPLALAGLTLLAGVLHFWGLDRFNTLVFDEVYYPKFANDYLTHKPLFDAHPPLGKYMIALGMWLGDHAPFGHDGVANTLTGALRPPWVYRWMDAFIGTLLPLVVAGIAYQLSHRRIFALTAGFFMALDGLFLVESRYGLINIYLVFFGLLGNWFFLVALESKGGKRWWRLAGAGVCLGAACAVKWNGAGYLGGIYVFWLGTWLVRGQLPKDWGRLPWLPMVANLGVLPVLTYVLVWIPHLQINRDTNFWQVHWQMLQYHLSMGNGPQVHPYCSEWYTWPLMLRPMNYFYQNARSLSDPLPTNGPLLPENVGHVVYTIVAMGNPFLWWLSTGAMAAVLLGLVWGCLVRRRLHLPLIPFYLGVNYLANYLPWIAVRRCTFIYLYMEAVVFSFLALAYLVARGLEHPQGWVRSLALGAIFLVTGSFIYWLPVYLGLPISLQDFYQHMWLRSWI